MKNRRSVYLDHSATTPTDPRVVEKMLPYFTEFYGNASSIHGFGRKAEQAIEDAREMIAKILHCDPIEIVFTSGGSESDNLALRGAAWTAQQQGRGNHLITTPVEHSAIGRTTAQLAALMGFERTLLPVDRHAQIDEEDFIAACRPETTLASVIYANNEVGTIAPIPQLAQIAHERGIWLHTDAVQAAGQLPLDVEVLGVDLMSLSAHKFYGPKGVGVLYVRKGIDLVPSQTGGSHEENRRAGTHNTPAIVGMAYALQWAYDERETRIAHYRAMRDQLITGILAHISDVELTGHPQDRLPSHASFVFDGIDSTKLLMHLDMKGVAASGGSACKTGNPEPSSVLLAMGYPAEQAIGTLRLSVGLQTTPEDVEYAVNAVADSVEKLRKLNRVLSS
ncbi:MAG: cysteine desulfurase [Anaerolineae bacterium]|jgi:cysteine desulfurase|nr:cysteine desulfurase [Anaerolineae bacterium]